MQSQKWITGVLASLTFALSAGAQASVADTYTTFDFVGKCTDCEGYGRAHLTLLNYNYGDWIHRRDDSEVIFNEGGEIIGVVNDPANFVSFSYDGSNLFPAFSITPGRVAHNSYGVITSPQNSLFNLFSVDSITDRVDQYGEPIFWYFFSDELGNWSLGIQGHAAPADYGTDGTWVQATSNQVPEPSTLALLSLAGVALGVGRKRSIPV